VKEQGVIRRWSAKAGLKMGDYTCYNSAQSYLPKYCTGDFFEIQSASVFQRGAGDLKVLRLK
tara:strand:- start:12407 stop:12592 length:186 start_codon:yes stop_codon:yes gene_type:complete